MTIELWILVTMGFFTLLLGFVPGIVKLKKYDLIGTKNFQRDNLPPLDGKGGRAERAISNLYENLPLFTFLVIAISITGANNEMTALGAQLFLIGRVLHPVFYIFGPHYLRSLSWFIAASGMVMMALQLG